jgi:ubiquinone/menaquinone biosynthesis C-methylase UbiE
VQAGPRLLTVLAILAALAAPVSPTHAQAQRQHGRLFPPQDLGLLEGPDREKYQRPDQIMDHLGIGEGSLVADLGAGGGWFTIRLARRVGPNGRVYAQDIQPEMIGSIERRVQREGLKDRVEMVLGKASDPNLPVPVDVVLIVDAYHEMTDPVALLKNVRKSLRPGGRVGIVEASKAGHGPGPPMEERVDPETVIRDAEMAGLRLKSRGDFLRYQYLLEFVAADTTAK